MLPCVWAKTMGCLPSVSCRSSLRSLEKHEAVCRTVTFLQMLSFSVVWPLGSSSDYWITHDSPKEAVLLYWCARRLDLKLGRTTFLSFPWTSYLPTHWFLVLPVFVLVSQAVTKKKFGSSNFRSSLENGLLLCE